MGALAVKSTTPPIIRVVAVLKDSNPKTSIVSTFLRPTDIKNAPAQMPFPYFLFVVDEDHVVNTAQEHGESSGQNELFTQGLSFVKSQLVSVIFRFGFLLAHLERINKGGGGGAPPSHEFDEQGVKDAHATAYSQGNSGSLDASSLGAAAALQAFKNFTQGGGASSGGNTQSKLIGLAMGEASKLFDSQGAAGGSKQDAVNGAAQMAMKLLLKSQMSSFIGGGNSGGLGGLAGLVSSDSCAIR